MVLCFDHVGGMDVSVGSASACPFYFISMARWHTLQNLERSYPSNPELSSRSLLAFRPVGIHQVSYSKVSTLEPSGTSFLIFLSSAMSCCIRHLHRERCCGQSKMKAGVTPTLRPLHTQSSSRPSDLYGDALPSRYLVDGRKK